VPRPIEVSVPEAGPVSVTTAPLAPGQFIPVPEDAHVSMADTSPEAVNKALWRPRGPLTHEWCLANSPLWKAQCVAREQGWDLAWVWAQMGKKSTIRVAGPRSEGGKSSALAVAVVPHAVHGKRKAAPGPGPVRQACCRVSPVRLVVKAGSSRSHVFLPRSGRLLPPAGGSQVWPRESQVAVMRLSLENAELRREQNGNLAQIRAQAEELAWARCE
ncbi:hypothetical protein C0992_006023, partial [Termitomyces sp. T32_za158]